MSPKISYFAAMSGVCLIGVLLNYAAMYFFCMWLNIPLFLDTIFTISITFLYGPLWGAITGGLYNIFCHTLIDMSNWMGYLFALCSIATALITHLFVRLFSVELSLSSRQTALSVLPQKSQRLNAIMGKIIVLILLSFALCLAMSILGGSIAAFIIHRTPLLTIDNVTASGVFAPTLIPDNMPLVLSEILARIPINIIDRLVSVFLGFGFALIVQRFILRRGNFLTRTTRTSSNDAN